MRVGRRLESGCEVYCVARICSVVVYCSVIVDVTIGDVGSAGAGVAIYCTLAGVGIKGTRTSVRVLLLPVDCRASDVAANVINICTVAVM